MIIIKTIIKTWETLGEISVKKRWKNAFKKAIFGDLVSNGLKQDIKNFLVILVNILADIISLLLSAFGPIVIFADAFYKSYKTVKHLENCEGCGKCNHLRDED